MSEEQDAERGNGKTECRNECGGDNGLLCVLVVFCTVFCDEAGYGEGDPRSSRGREYGEDGERDLVQAHAFGAECAG